MKKKKINFNTWHGSMGKEEWKLPVCVAKTDKVNRKDQGNLTNASEFLDDMKVLDEKMKIVADLVKKSKNCICYTGAGISRASGIADYGTKAKDSVMKSTKVLQFPIHAKPSYSHKVLTNMEKKGYIVYYVQQNHDGLPQKAGFPQEKMNEIHGAWFDPSNPVVQFSGNLRGDLFSDMVYMEKKTDLCLVLGTSLSGMNADRIVRTPCKKYAKGQKDCFGSVIVNLQWTPLDKPGYVPIRIWSKIDDAMKLLVKHLGDFEVKDIEYGPVKDDKVICPYNEKGQFDESKKMVLDFSLDSKVKIVQPGAVSEGEVGEVIRIDKEGHYQVSFKKPNSIKRYPRRIGYWWLACAKEGKIRQLPVINLEPKFL